MSKLSEFIGVQDHKEFKLIGSDAIVIQTATFKIGGGELLIKYQNSDTWYTANININELLGLTPIPLPDKILTDEEKDYLKAVIYPVRDKVRYIHKTIVLKNFPNIESLFVTLIDDTEFTTYPFKVGTEFKGMEQHKYYTLKELGL